MAPTPITPIVGLWGLVLLLGAAGPLVAQTRPFEPADQLRAIRPAAQTRPATAPDQPRATVDADAQGLLKDVGEAYLALTSVELSGQISLALVEDGKPRRHEAGFRSSFAAPNLFRHEAAGQPLLGSTGQKLYAFLEARNAYVQVDAPPARCPLRELPPDHVAILLMQNLGLALSLSDDPAEELRRMASRISAGAPQNVDGVQMLSLRLSVPDRGPLELLIHPRTKLIRRVVMDFGPVFAKMGRTDVTSALYTIDYTTIDSQARPGTESFAWSPPAGATNLAQTRPATEPAARR